MTMPTFFLPPRSLRVRLAFAFTLFIAALLLAADAGLVSYVHYRESQRTNSELEQALETIRVALVEEEHEANTSPVYKIDSALETLRETRPILAQDGVSAVILDSHGRFWQTGAGSSRSPKMALTVENGWRTRSLQMRPDQAGRSETLTVTVGIPWHQKEIALQRQAILLLILTLFTVLVAGVGVYFLVGRTLQPINRLAQQALEQSRQHLSGSVRLSAPSPDTEVTGLVRTLNHLLETIAENTEMKSRFYTAASHELRTPLQILSGRVELTLSRPRSQEEYQTALAEVQEQADHLVALAQSLLLLNRLERATPPNRFVAVDVSSLCREQLRAAQAGESAYGLSIAFEQPSPSLPRVKAADPAHVEILVRNLLDNALRYTPQKGSIRLTLRVEHTSSAPAVRMDIVNTSSVIPPADEARLLEPFYRPDPSRNSSTGGNGLGLTICRALSELNGWKFSLQQYDGSFQVTVIFPAHLPEA